METEMKFFNVKRLAKEQGGEYVLGMKDLHTHACYLIFGTLAPEERAVSYTHLTLPTIYSV